MACRCSEIRRCSRDMTQIMIAICRAKNTLPHVQDIETNIKTLSDHSPDGYTTDNMEDLCAAMRRLDDEISPTLEGLIAALEAEYDRLADLQERLEQEDDHHHEAQRRASMSSEE